MAVPPKSFVPVVLLMASPPAPTTRSVVAVVFPLPPKVTLPSTHKGPKVVVLVAPALVEKSPMT